MSNAYDSLYTGTHNDNYENRIKTLEDQTLNNRITTLENFSTTADNRLNILEGYDLNNRVTIIENLSNIIYNNVSVAVTDWETDSTYTLYPYKADLVTTGVDATMFPNVVFDLNDAISGYFAPISASFTNTVRIYASNIPLNTITIPTIKITKNGG